MSNRERRDNGATDGLTSRRTVAKGLAWTVPVISVATAAPAFAVSPPPPPPPPNFQFENSYKNPGDSCKTLPCIPKQSYGVPVTVTNNTGVDYYIQFTSYFIGSNAAGVGGTNRGVFGITTNRSNCTRVMDECALVPCPDLGMTSSNTVCIPAGETLTFEVTSGTNFSSPNGGQRIDYRFIRKADCSIAATSFAATNVSPPNQAC